MLEDLLWLDWDTLQPVLVTLWHSRLAQAMMIVVAAYVLRKIGEAILDRIVSHAVKNNAYRTGAEHKKRVKTLLGVLGAFMTFGIYIIAGMMIIQLFGIQTGPLLASASIIGVAIGFGTQSLVKDLVTGMFIIIENQYRVGDEVALGAFSGTVERIGIRTTVLRDLDGNVHYVPNGSVITATNRTLHFTRINFNVNVIYETDLKLLEKVINKVGDDMAKDTLWGKRLIEPPRFQRVENFASNGLDIKIVGATKPGKLQGVLGELRRRLLETFDDHGIIIPHPAPPAPKNKDETAAKKPAAKK